MHLFIGYAYFVSEKDLCGKDITGIIIRGIFQSLSYLPLTFNLKLGKPNGMC